MYKDARMGGVEKWYNFPPSDANMRIPTEVLESVCFLSIKENETYKMIGTAFFIQITQDDFFFTYLFTAKHVIDGVREAKCNIIYARLNKVGGGIEYIDLGSIDRWNPTDSEGLDLAFLMFGLDQNKYQAKTINIDSIANEQIIKTHAIGIGDELFSVGLFTRRKGRKQNIPIVRTGIISAMPTEPLLDQYGDEFYAFLAELRSIGGLSGSPVFVYMHRASRLYVPTESNNEFEIYLLGVVRGRWDARKYSEVEALESGEKLIEPLNTGIAIVTPAKYILDFLEHPEVIKYREEVIKYYRQKDNFIED